MHIRKGVPRSDEDENTATYRKDTPAASRGDKGDKEDFLVKEFDIPPHEAADLVGEDDPDAAAAQAQRRNRREDAPPDGPVPDKPEHETVPDSDEVRLKPVLGRNDRSGAG